jgi:hypothetical protein
MIFDWRLKLVVTIDLFTRVCRIVSFKRKGNDFLLIPQIRFVMIEMLTSTLEVESVTEF